MTLVQYPRPTPKRLESGVRAGTKAELPTPQAHRWLPLPEKTERSAFPYATPKINLVLSLRGGSKGGLPEVASVLTKASLQHGKSVWWPWAQSSDLRKSPMATIRPWAFSDCQEPHWILEGERIYMWSNWEQQHQLNIPCSAWAKHSPGLEGPDGCASSETSISQSLGFLVCKMGYQPHRLCEASRPAQKCSANKLLLLWSFRLLW